jgi:sec-independent protein translocase protein TatA
MGGFGAPEMLIVLLVILVVFGGSQLPKLARGLGSAQREFKKGLEEGQAEEPSDKTKKSE